MRRSFLSLAVMILFGFGALLCQAQTIPSINAKALDDSEVTLPKPGSQQLLILVLGFSHKSGDACTAWGKPLAGEFTSESSATYDQMPELQSAPSLVRGMILRGMRKKVPDSQHSRFVPL